MNKKIDQQENEKMKSYTFRLPPSLLNEALQKAGMIPFSKIVRRLIEKWLKGEISID